MSTHELEPAPRTASIAAPGMRSAARNSHLFILTVISTLGGLLFGYDTGVIAGALVYMREDLHLNSLQEGTIVSSLLFGAMFGALLGGRIADALGRKGSLLVCAVLFLVGALGSAAAPNVGLMVLARIILGLAVGAASVTVPVYLAEMAPAHRRGRIVAINELMIVTGVLLAFVINVVIDQTVGGQHAWRWMLAVAAIPAILLLVGMFFLPDSPRWYAVKSRLEDTRRVLGLSRDPAEAAAEFAIIAEHAERDVAEDKGAAVRDLRAFPWMRRTLWIGIGLAVAQQTTGVNTIAYYGTTILKSTGLGTSAALLATVSLGVIAVVGMLIGIYLLNHLTRRQMLLFGFSAVAASHALLAVSFLLPESPFRSYLILAAMLLFMLFMQAFIGLVVWIVLSEIFPMTIRGVAMGIAVFMLWTVNTIISFVFPILTASFGPMGTFGLFA
ncbi:MAG TPA: sugar porter family MFS transporter, partial [Mycobacteriales bacterium]|nr:sugar porter family MFS transporter [Mycobacteriales bacterium]